MQQAAIIEAFTDVPDPRSRAGQRHSVSLCLALFTLAIAAGNKGFLAIGNWIEVYQSELIELLNVEPKRLPSYSTIRRVLLQLDYQKYAQCVAKFLGIRNFNGEILNLDSTNSNLESHPAIKLVIAYLEERDLLLELQGSDHKPYELRGLPEVIKTMALKGVVFAIDAIRTQTKPGKNN